MSNVNTVDSDSSLSPAISNPEDPADSTSRVVSTLRQLSESPEAGDAVSDEKTAFEKLAQYKPQDSKDETVRILESFIHNLPLESRKVIMKFINISDDHNIFDLAYHLRTAVLIPMKAEGGKTPQVTPLPFSATDITREIVASEMTQSSSRNDQGRLKTACLQRDNYKCVVTKIWDPVAVSTFNIQGAMTLRTQLAHIIPFSMGHWENEWKEKEIAQCWETLYLLFPSIKDIIMPTTVNTPANAMTMAVPVHQDFGSFQIAFTPTDKENTYRIKVYPGHQTFFGQYYAKPITFTKNSASASELPSKDLLKMHAAIAEILQASGQGEKIDELLRKWDDIRCLASDGSTDLESLLSLVSVH
ncbi:HNH endonuclease signature motif containing protein [Aspergillus novofumigatus IBT 16806]|uniref:HNH nuclease domain-containing protein n=1 Tax=Aspergillus novofumigatus (strain IBT 16806) TaxID=1392255 RepID=A0A2I1CLF8_ASPN1|nr:uncharacterized protein P174DRAFT_416175 [Aspergillus novofumigatus IBT 16806]PKX98436.1 hypothetical protein P174DRAFT_416175 [Aspergillus novofumigatus IBT 16806]